MRLLVACEGCRRQFDASGQPVGSRFHCNCGLTLVVPSHEGHTAAVVRCASCGGPRSARSSTCEWCRAEFAADERLLNTICPICWARISDRGRHCHHCGTPIVPEGLASEATDHDCPACGDTHRLNSRRFESVEIAVMECPGCSGLWLGASAFELLLDRARRDRPAQPTPDTLPALEAANLLPSGRLYRACPSCKEWMLRENFGRGSRVIVDRCRLHGVWFDADELQRILSWVKRGGEDRVRTEVEISQRSARFDRALERARPRRYDEVPRPGDLSDTLWVRILEALFAGR